MSNNFEWEPLIMTEILRADLISGAYEEIDIKDTTEEEIEESSFEISVIRKNNKHAHESWGWGGNDKIILFDEIESKQNYDWAIKIANTIAKALNKEGL